jgi:hypothetical protein
MDGSHNRNILGVIGVDCHSLGWLQLPTARSKRGLEAWKRLGSLLDCFIVVRYLVLVSLPVENTYDGQSTKRKDDIIGYRYTTTADSLLVKRAS